MCEADTPAEAGVDWEAAAVLRRGRPFLGLGSEWSAVLLCSAVLCRGKGRKGREGRGLGDASGAEPSPQVSAEVTVGAWCLCGGKMATVAAPGSEEGKQL